MNAETPEAQAPLPVSPSPVKGLRLPEPDRENITVLLHNLPNAPVLPWNHYDSPWEGEEPDPQTEDSIEPTAEVPPEVISPLLENAMDSEEREADPDAPELVDKVDLLPDSGVEEVELAKIPFEPGFVNLAEGRSETLTEEESLLTVRILEEREPPAIVFDPVIQEEIPFDHTIPLDPNPPQEAIENSPEDIEEKLLSQLG